MPGLVRPRQPPRGRGRRRATPAPWSRTRRRPPLPRDLHVSTRCWKHADEEHASSRRWTPSATRLTPRPTRAPPGTGRRWARSTAGTTFRGRPRRPRAARRHGGRARGGAEVAVLGPVEDVAAAAVPHLAARELQAAPHVRVARDDSEPPECRRGVASENSRPQLFGLYGIPIAALAGRRGDRGERRQPQAGQLPDADVAVVPGESRRTADNPPTPTF